MDRLRTICKTLFNSILLIGLVVALILSASYFRAKHTAIKYLQIITIRDEQSYQKVKADIYNIVSPEVRRIVFNKEKYEGPSYPPVDYRINSVQGKIVGLNYYVFKINWTINGSYTVDSIIRVKEGIIIDAHRED